MLERLTGVSRRLRFDINKKPPVFGFQHIWLSANLRFAIYD